MKKFIVMYSPTPGAQPSLQSLSKKAPEFVYEFETTDLQKALEVAKKEVEVSDLTTVKELPYSPTDEEFYKMIHEKVEALPWTKAIIVYIDLPE